ncbi:MAG TPA: hypothetical protein VKV16_08420 [Solirubrobacteraceae bacterium]|nr:hypothetical protein [Solirubrobacteraceae bacterium]
MRAITGLLKKPMRTTTSVIVEVLRIEAAALSELGRLAESLGELIRETLDSEPTPTVPDPLASSAPAQSPRRPSATPDEHARATIVSPDVPAPDVPASAPSAPSSDARRKAPGRRSNAPLRPVETPAASLGEPSPPSTAPAAPPEPPQSAPPPAAARGGHVDEEAVLVSESADEGAQDGAGASIHVQEPWSGYRKLRAREIVDHLPAVADEVLSLVLLYEGKPGRSRQSVIRAAEQELSRRAA